MRPLFLSHQNILADEETSSPPFFLFLFPPLLLFLLGDWRKDEEEGFLPLTFPVDGVFPLPLPLGAFLFYQEIFLFLAANWEKSESLSFFFAPSLLKRKLARISQTSLAVAVYDAGLCVLPFPPPLLAFSILLPSRELKRVS